MVATPANLGPNECSPSASRIGGRPASDYIWLAYSVFFFIDPILRHSPRYWAACGAIYAVFLAIYITYVNVRRRQVRYWLLGAFFLLGLVSFPFNSGATSFMIYSAAFLPFAVEQVWIVRGVLVGQCFAVAGESLLVRNHSSTINLAATVFFIAIVGAANSFIAEQKRADSRLRLANDEIEQLAALAERERIARDLHDVLGHTLSVIVLKAELAGRLLEGNPGGERAAREIADVERTARTALAEVREAIGGYRAKGLAAELELARDTLRSAGVALSCETPIPRLAAAPETVLSLALREAVTNIVRHARAQHCRIHFATTRDGFHSLHIEDDGVGLTSTGSILQGGNGLRGMRERVEGTGGRFSILAGANSRGTALTVELPPTAPVLHAPEPARLVEA